jgi:hypothetical protein
MARLQTQSGLSSNSRNDILQDDGDLEKDENYVG